MPLLFTAPNGKRGRLDAQSAWPAVSVSCAACGALLAEYDARQFSDAVGHIAAASARLLDAHECGARAGGED